jgi:membrane protease YdiL (CAAX protease family)/CheY-like chemotaxis protein
MMERVRILVVATPTAPVRGLAARLRDPDVEVVVTGTAREALERVSPSMPDVVVIDGSLPGREIFRLYGRLRATPAGTTVPIIFSAHERTSADAAATTSLDYYLGPDATLDDVEQLVFTFLPESLLETDEATLPDEADLLARALSARGAHPEPVEQQPPTAPLWADALERLQTGPALIALAYLGIYGAAEVLAAGLDARFGLFVHGILLVAIWLHAYNVGPGPERTFFMVLWLAPLTRIYGLGQPYANLSPLAWWAITAGPTLLAGIVAFKFGGQTAREAGLVPRPQEVPIAVFLIPVGMALGVLIYLLIEPRALGRELATSNLALVALVVIINPAVVDEIVFRGIIQRAGTAVLGTGLSILYTSLLYAAILPAGLNGGLTGVVVTFCLGLLLSAITLRTGSILSAATAHAGLALGLFVIAPYVVPGGLGLPGGAPAGPTVPETRPPATKPVVVVSPVPTLVPAPASGQPQPGTAGQPTPAGQAAQPSPAQPTQPGPTPASGLATPVSLAPPPVSPPTQPTSAPPASSAAGQQPANGSGQIVVVRGTGGSGARLRSQPGNNGPIITVVPEYTPLVVIGPDRQVDGIVWRSVRAPNGLEGWIAASFVTTGQ